MSSIHAVAFSYSSTKAGSGVMDIEPSCSENNISYVQKLKSTEKMQDFAVDEFHLTKQADVGGRSVLSENNRSFLEDLSNSNLNINANMIFSEKEDSFIDLIDIRDASNGGASPLILNEQFSNRQQSAISDHYNIIWNSSEIDVIKTKKRKAVKRNKSLIGVAQKKIAKNSSKYIRKRKIPGLLLRNRIGRTLLSDKESFYNAIDMRKVRKLPDLLPSSEVKSNRNINRYFKVDNRDYKYGENHQMGVDIGNKLKSISLSNDNESDRSDIPLTDASLIKYRKVNNTFPKFMSHTSDEKYRLQKSNFTPQPMTHKVVKNCGCVDGEFSCKRLDQNSSLNQAFGSYGNSTCIGQHLSTEAKTVSSLPSFNDSDKYAELFQTLEVYFDTLRYAPPTLKKLNCSSQKVPQHSSCSERVNSTAHCNVPLPNCSKDLGENSDEYTLVKENSGGSPQVKRFPTTTVVGDDPMELLDLTKYEQTMISECSTIKDNDIICSNDHDSADKMELSEIAPVNSLKERFDLSPYIKEDWLKNFDMKFMKKQEESKKLLIEVKTMVDKRSAERIKAERRILCKMAEISIFDPRTMVTTEFLKSKEDEDQLVKLSDHHYALIRRVLHSPPDQVHNNKFNLKVTTRDLYNLTSKRGLNDEVINFYMNLLTERSEKNNQMHGLPKVYAMNTFFMARLLKHGFSAVKRWTRKVDIFEKDIIPVPVYLSGGHWCMAIIHLKNKSIKFYNSKGAPNPRVLNALEKYLKKESLDKKNIPFDASGFVVESVEDVPRQKNDVDCGVFSCMFAEFITRDKAITFSQEHIKYFRNKMIVEIVQGDLISSVN